MLKQIKKEEDKDILSKTESEMIKLNDLVSYSFG